MIFAPYSYWAFAGIFYLLYLTWQDLRHNMTIDDRKNAFMLGLTVSLYWQFHVVWWYLTLIILLEVALIAAFKIFKTFGDGDLSSLTWIILGFGLIGHAVLAMFFSSFIAVTAIYLTIKTFLLRVKGQTPFFPVIVITFILTTWLAGVIRI